MTGETDLIWMDTFSGHNGYSGTNGYGHNDRPYHNGYNGRRSPREGQRRNTGPSYSSIRRGNERNSYGHGN